MIHLGGISSWLFPLMQVSEALSHRHTFALERDGRPTCYCGTNTIEAAQGCDVLVFELPPIAINFN